MSEINPYQSPRSNSAPSIPARREINAVWAIVLGACVAFLAIILLVVCWSVLFMLFVLPKDWTELSRAEQHNLVLNAPFAKLAVVLCWTAGLAAGSFVGAWRCASRWMLVSFGIASTYLFLWGIPSFVLNNGELSSTQWTVISLIVPASLIGGGVSWWFKSRNSKLQNADETNMNVR